MEKYIPQGFLSKMNTFNIKIGEVDVKATVLDNDHDSMACCLTAIKSSVKNLPVVGIDVKRCSSGGNVELLLIYAENHCLIVRLGRMNSVPSVLSSFLADDSICFVGMKIENLITFSHNVAEPIRPAVYSYASRLASGAYSYNVAGPSRPASGVYSYARKLGTLRLRTVEIGHLAGRVLKSENLRRCESLVELARKAGDFKGVAWKTSFASSPPDWNEGIFFEQEQVEYTMQDVFLCYFIGKKLLERLG